MPWNCRANVNVKSSDGSRKPIDCWSGWRGTAAAVAPTPLHALRCMPAVLSYDTALALRCRVKRPVRSFDEAQTLLPWVDVHTMSLRRTASSSTHCGTSITWSSASACLFEKPSPAFSLQSSLVIVYGACHSYMSLYTVPITSGCAGPPTHDVLCNCGFGQLDHATAILPQLPIGLSFRISCRIPRPIFSKNKH